MDLNEILFQTHIRSETPGMEALSSFLKKGGKRAVLMTDKNVFSRHAQHVLDVARGSGITIEPIVIEPGEASKSLKTAEACWAAMHAAGLDRTSLVIGLGGGVVTDLAGFVAACYMRGIDVIQIPTSLMGMVDAAIGGKTAVNLSSGKNLIGAFHQPKLTLLCPHFLESLPERQLRSGLAEVIKSAVIHDCNFFEYLEKQLSPLEYLIEKSARIKIEIVRKDEKDANMRALLNWGHTVAHALETITRYNRYLHGEAVAIGMCAEAAISSELGLVDCAFVERQRKLIEAAGLPSNLPEINLDELITLMQSDKKSTSGEINLVVAKGIGKLELRRNVDKNVIKKALTTLQCD